MTSESATDTATGITGKGYIPVDGVTSPGTQATYYIVHEKKGE